MESLLSPVSLLLFCAGLFFFIRVASEWFAGFKARGWSPPLPPGPRGLPIIGSIHRLAVGGLPHHTLAGLARRHGPLMLLRLGQVDVAVASSREAAEDVLKTHDLNFAFRPMLALSMLLEHGLGFSPYDSHYRHLRKVAAVELFSIRRVRSFTAVREEQVRNMINNIKTAALSRAPVKLREELMLLSNSIVSVAAVGRRCRHEGKLVKLTKEAARLASGFAMADLFPSLKFVDVLTGMRSKLEGMRRELQEILDKVIRDKEMCKGNGGDEDATKQEEDILDVLLRLKDDNNQEFPITLSNVKVVILELFIAGTETSSTIIEWAMSELIRNPKIMEKAQSEIREALEGKPNVEEADLGQLSYLRLVIKEAFRLHPPGPLLVPRVAQETCQVIGYTIPAGTRMLINAWALGRDPQYWAEAERFKPERFEDSSVDLKGANFEFLPFGSGRRMCPGMVFGLANVELALAQLLFHFDWSLPGGMKPQDLDMTEAFGAAASRKSELVLLATPHFPANIC
ncbi:Alpha-humulene 10-hydroxylase [Ananas comosus]|uniref:Alpha-humulene 10-hydroxylase n=1 Tax=Ananas comosus TaxID=4615 RepID=A0A199VJQ9_ANACO|nr:Alpha-humulene 10-hydroxylase [Ananas comosus]